MTFHTRRSFAFIVVTVILTACGGSTAETPAATVVVRTQTGGQQLDPNGYTLTGSVPGIANIGTNEAKSFPDIAPDDYTVTLNGIASNCHTPDTTQAFALANGATDTIPFIITCDTTFGSVQVTVTTTGGAPDTNGYQVRVDAIDRGNVAATGQLAVPGLSPGHHIVALTGLATNCSMNGPSADTVDVAAGASAPAALAVFCPAPTALTVQVTTTGVGQDPNGYDIVIDGTAHPVNASDTLGPLPLTLGDHSVVLRGIVMNCLVAGDTARAVDATDGGTANVGFNVSCTAPVVAYAQSVSGEGYSIWRMNPDGTNPLVIVPFATQGGGRAPAWSPDRSKLAFARMTGDVGNGLTRVNADGTGLLTIFDSAGVSVPRWSPDGATILFRRHPGGAVNPELTRMWLVDADGSDPHPLIADSLGAFGGDWSPTGDRIAFTRYRPNGAPTGFTELVILDVASGTQTVIVADSVGPSYSPRWRPNSEQIAFQCMLLKICIVNSNGSGLAVINVPGQPVGAFNWSPDGTELVSGFAVGPGVIHFHRTVWGSGVWTPYPSATGHRIEPTW